MYATLLAALAQITHPAVLLPMTAALVVGRLPWERDRRALVRHYLVSVVPAVPAALVVWRSPVFAESSSGVKLLAFLGTILPRSLALLVPVILLPLARRHRLAWTGPLAAGALVVANMVMWQPLGLPWARGSLYRRPNTAMVDFIDSSAFVPDRTYRVLRIADGKIGMYQLLRADARLDSEFFPESILIQSWPGEAAYSAFLRRRRVDDVMVWRGYIRLYGVNEDALLRRLVRDRLSNCDGPRVCVTLAAQTHDWRLYRVTRRGHAPPSATTA